jgi:hypothetical protein
MVAPMMKVSAEADTRGMVIDLHQGKQMKNIESVVPGHMRTYLL